MLFQTPAFLFAFLPLLLLAWRFSAGYGVAGHAAVLLGFSCVFYAVSGLSFLVLLAVLLFMNHAFARVLAHPEEIPPTDTECQPVAPRILGLHRRGILCLALALNLLPLVWCKYAAFLVQNVAALFHTSWNLPQPGLPPGISFFTFIQIAWLVSVYRNQVHPESLTRHALFSTAFPWILSGPIVRYEQIGPQLDTLTVSTAAGLARGFALFTVGLAKKILLADSLAPYADAVFHAAEQAFPLSGGEAWLGSLAYTFQLYFDFSGYTDMALGLGLMLGLRLPQNFLSPYKSTGFVEFWRRWHITLSSWLRDFLYIPLGGNRHGRLTQYRNLFLTMLIGGAWHGVGWTFLVWGALHGLFLCINHFFRGLIRHTIVERALSTPVLRVLCIATTFLTISLCWVAFRATSLEGAWHLYVTLFSGPFTPEAAGILNPADGLAGLSALAARWLPNGYIQGWMPLGLLLTCLLVVFTLPNSHEIFWEHNDKIHPRITWHPTLPWAVGLACLALASFLLLSRQSTFLYFQF